MELLSSLPVAKQPTFTDKGQSTAVSNAQGQTSLIKIEIEPSLSMDGTVEDGQSRPVYRMKAEEHAEAKLIHTNKHPDKAVDFPAGIQHSEVNSVSNESQSVGKMHESDDGDSSPMQSSSDIGSRTRVDDKAKSTQEQDNQNQENTLFRFGFISTFAYPRTNEIISQHLSSPSQQSFTTLNELLSSHNSPGRGLYSVEKVLEHEKGRVVRLEDKLRYIQAELEQVRARRDKTDEIVRQARTTFSTARIAAGIRKELWKEYEAFCESLEPKSGSRDGWSVTCFENHNGSYVQWDPCLELFSESAEMSLRRCNFRCEATTIEKKGCTEYVVEFWPVARFEPRTETAKTWKQQYPNLYRLAKQAANDSSRDSTIAKALLRSLPSPNLPFTGGWLFEYALEPGRGEHLLESRRWTYRSASRIPIAGQHDPDDGTAQSETDSSASQDEKMKHDGSETAESEDVNMEDEESETCESSGSQDVNMEDDA